MTVLVLGGSGFIGSNLIRRLHAQGQKVRGYSSRLPPTHVVDALGSPEWIAGDISDEEKLRQAFSGVEICYHLASTTVPRTSNDNPIFDVESNLRGTLVALKQAALAGVGRFVFVSSGGTVYGVPDEIPITESHPLNPISSYGIVKATIEQYLEFYRRRHALNYTVVRLSNPYGPCQRPDGAQGAVAVFMYRMLKRHPIAIWGDGSVVRDYIFIDDALDGVVAAANYRGEQRAFNIGSGQGHSLLEVISAIESVCGSPADIAFHPMGTMDVPKNILSIEKARTHLGFLPNTPFADGLLQTAKWMNEEFFGYSRAADNPRGTDALRA